MTELMQQIEETINRIKTLMNERYNEVNIGAISILVYWFSASTCCLLQLLRYRNQKKRLLLNTKTQFVKKLFETLLSNTANR